MPRGADRGQGHATEVKQPHLDASLERFIQREVLHNLRVGADILQQLPEGDDFVPTRHVRPDPVPRRCRIARLSAGSRATRNRDPSSRQDALVPSPTARSGRDEQGQAEVRYALSRGSGVSTLLPGIARLRPDNGTRDAEMSSIRVRRFRFSDRSFVQRIARCLRTV